MIKFNQSLLFTMAKRYAWNQKPKTLLYKLSRLACYSITLGIAILLLVLFSLNGMELWLSSLFYKHKSTLNIAPKQGKTFASNPKLKQTLKQIPQILDIVEILEETCLVRLNGKQCLATIKGVSANFMQDDLFKEHPWIKIHFLQKKKAPYQAIMANPLCQDLALNIENYPTVVDLFYPKSNAIHTNWLQPPYRKSSIIITDSFAQDASNPTKSIIAPLNCVEKLTHSYGKRSFWEISLIKNVPSLKTLQDQIQQYLPDNLTISNQHEKHCARQKAIAIERLSVYFIFILVLFLALLHLLLMLCMLILEKKQSIKTLYFLGLTPQQIGYIFWYSGILITLEGTLYGTILAYILGVLQQKVGLLTLHKIHGQTIIYPIAMHGQDFLYTISLTIVLGILTGIWPAFQAKKLTKTFHSNVPYA